MLSNYPDSIVYVHIVLHSYVDITCLYSDSVPRIPWAFAMAEACGLILCYMFLLILLLHKHR